MNDGKCQPACRSLKAPDHAANELTIRRLRQGFASSEMGLRGHCKAAIWSRECPLWVKSRHRRGSAECPLYPQKQTLIERVGMSALCQKRTLCAAKKMSLFHHLVGAGRSPEPQDHQKRTFVEVNWMSALCQFETHALEHSRDAVIAQHVQLRIDRSSR